MQDDETIIRQILYKLDGWKLEDDLEDDVLIEAEYNKLISSDEVLHFYNVAYNYALAFTKLSTFPTITKTIIVDEEEIETTEIEPITFTALILWSAGLLWRKYNIRSNDQIDDSYTIGYGDSLIIQAKEMLKGYKDYRFYAY